MKESLEELAGLYVFDQLESAERTAFEARLMRDPELAQMVHALEAGLAQGIRALPRQAPPPETLGRIEARISALPSEVARPAPATAAFRWMIFARWGLAAVVAISLATLAVQSLRLSPTRSVVVFVGLDANRNTFAELPLRGTTKDPDARFIQLASLAENFWGNGASLPIKPASAAGNSHGYALFDPGSGQGFIAIEQLPVAAKNQRYHLWIVDPSTARISDAGILPLAGMNRGLYSFTLGSDDGPKSDRPNFFVTVEENDTGSPSTRPQGKVVLGDRRI